MIDLHSPLSDRIAIVDTSGARTRTLWHGSEVTFTEPNDVVDFCVRLPVGVLLLAIGGPAAKILVAAVWKRWRAEGRGCGPREVHALASWGTG